MDVRTYPKIMSSNTHTNIFQISRKIVKTVPKAQVDCKVQTGEEYDFIDSEKERSTPLWLTESMWTTLKSIKKDPPLIQCFTNHVSADIVSSGLESLGCDALFIEDTLPEQVFDSRTGCIYCNIGTVNASTFFMMTQTIKHICRLKPNIRWVFDPLAAMYTDWRADVICELLNLSPSVVVTNAMEVVVLSVATGSSEINVLNRNDNGGIVKAAIELSKSFTTTIAVIDPKTVFVTNGDTTLNIAGGERLFKDLSTVASGRSLVSSLISAFVSQCNSDEQIIFRVAHALSFICSCYETAIRKTKKKLFGGSLKIALIDEIFSLTKERSLVKIKIRDVHWTVPAELRIDM